MKAFISLRPGVGPEVLILSQVKILKGTALQCNAAVNGTEYSRVDHVKFVEDSLKKI